MCYLMYGEPNLCWFVEPFYVYNDDYDEFFMWIETWPEAHAQRMHDGRVIITPADGEVEMAAYNGDYMIDLPTNKCGPEHWADSADFDTYDNYLVYMEEARGNWWTVEPDEGQALTDVFLHELSWRVAVNSTCVVKLIGGDGWGTSLAYAYGIVGGEEPPASRIVEMDLNEIYSRAAELDGATLMIGYHPDAIAAE